jgi:hypothetical protein
VKSDIIGDRMNRRAFIATATAILVAPFAADAQQAAKVPRIGFLGNSTAALEANLVGPFREGLRELGYVEGRNVLIEYRWAEGRYDRRAFITSLAAGALLASRSADAQKATRRHRIGWLSPASADDGLPNLEALRAGLRELGYVEGQNITIEARWADGRSERLPQLAAELVRLPVDILCTAGSQASGAAKHATSTIPIVFANVAFPGQSGLVESDARPGGNITGVAFIGPEYGKRLELLREALPRLSRVALIYNPDNPGSGNPLGRQARASQVPGSARFRARLRGDRREAA